MIWRLSRLICRLFGHRWEAHGRLDICARTACRGRPDATRYRSEESP